MAEMTEQEEMQVFELITAAGGAKSTFMEALYKAKEGKYDEAEKLFKEADGYFIQGHHAHAAMIEAEGQGVETTVRLVLAHMGGWRNWDEVEELLSQAPVYLDTSFSAGEMTPLDDGYYTSEDLPLMGERQFVRMVRTFGAERILFGTDSPWSGQRESLTWIRDTALSADELEAILGANAQKLLGLTGGRSFPAILGHPAETAG